jgi:hypothetical protein
MLMFYYDISPIYEAKGGALNEFVSVIICKGLLDIFKRG